MRFPAFLVLISTLLPALLSWPHVAVAGSGYIHGGAGEGHRPVMAPVMAQWVPRYPSTPLPKHGRGLFTVRVLGDTARLQQGRLESITIAVARAGDGPVTDAHIEISARARDVERRMQTRPRITGKLGDGRYQVGGLRFNMGGSWLLEFDITSGQVRDKALLELVIK